MWQSLEDVAKTESEEALRSVINAGFLDDPGALSAHMRLAEAEMRALAKQGRILERMARQTDDARRAAAIERRRVATGRRDELLEKLRHLRNSNRLAYSPGEHARWWNAIYTELALRREQLSHILACSFAVAGSSSLPCSTDPAASAWTILLNTKVAEEAALWASSTTATNYAITVLERAERENSQPSLQQQHLPSNMLRNQLDDVLKLQVRATAFLNSLRHHRRQHSDGTVDIFTDQTNLLWWCNEQQETLDGLISINDLQMFCESLKSNVTVMDTNFLVLLEKGESLGSNAAVREALVEANRAWFRLGASVYRMMRKAIREERVASGMEGACKWWVDSFEPRLRRTLAEAHAIATHSDTDAQSLLCAIEYSVSPLLKSLDSARTIVQHLSEITPREEYVTLHEEALHNTLLSRLSILTQTFTGDVKFDEQQEYSDRLRELADWLGSNATCSAYTRLMKRVEELRDIAEQQLRALNI